MYIVPVAQILSDTFINPFQHIEHDGMIASDDFAFVLGHVIHQLLEVCLPIQVLALKVVFHY